MPTAVVRIHFTSPVEPAVFEEGVAILRGRGIPLVEYTANSGEAVLDGIALLREEVQEWTPDEAVALCAEAFRVPALRGPTTYVSRGTDADAESVLARFGLKGKVRREPGPDGEVVVVTVAGADMRRVPESRLSTALEAALNAEVRIELVPAVNVS